MSILFAGSYQIYPWLFPVLADHDNELLVELLTSPYWTLRLGAALELARRGDERAKETLADSFYDAAPSIRANIVAALGQIADEEVIKLFVEVLEMPVDENPAVRREVANAMAAIARRESGSNKMREALAEASDLLVWQVLMDDNKRASDAAAIALAAIQGEEAIVMLKEFSHNSFGEHLNLINGLLAMKEVLGVERIRAELLNVLQERKAGTRLAAIRGLIELREQEYAGEQANRKKLEALRPTSYVQLLVKLALVRIKHQALAYKERLATAD